MTQKTAIKHANVIEFPQRHLRAKTTAESLATGVVNRGELTSIKSLTNYVAHNRNLPEEVVREYLLAEFKATDVTDLKRADYERVVRFLVDLQIDLIIN